MRPKQTDCQIEPAYPDHATVLFGVRFPSTVGHLPSMRCAIQEPHNIAECGEFDRLAPTLPVSATRVATREDLRRVFTTYEDAVQRAIDEAGDDVADQELAEARDALMDILQQAKATIETPRPTPKPCQHPVCAERGYCVGHRPDGSI